MISSISSSLPVQPEAAIQSAPEKVESVPQIKTDGADTVQISSQAQVKLLHQQGETITQIATKTKLDEATVKSYLGVKS